MTHLWSSTFTDKDALHLMQVCGYDERDQDYYRDLRHVFGFSPITTLCQIIHERGWEDTQEDEEAHSKRESRDE